jgi:hypothetical protein
MGIALQEDLPFFFELTLSVYQTDSNVNPILLQNGLICSIYFLKIATMKPSLFGSVL